MAKRFNRDYELVIDQGDEAKIITPPIRVSFSGDKNISGGLGNFKAEIYNLNENTRSFLNRDPVEGKGIDNKDFTLFQFRAGYNGDLRNIFKGNVHQAQTRRDGPDIITEIEALDGGFDFRNSFSSKTVTGFSVEDLVEDMPNTDVGQIREQPQLLRPKVINGFTADFFDDAIRQEDQWFIQDQKLHVIGPDETLGDGVAIVDASTGLLDTPTRQNLRVSFVSQFNPAIIVGGRVSLESELAPRLNGTYRVDTVSFTGDTHSSAWEQEVEATPI